MPWWAWAIFGFALLVAEVFTPTTFYLLLLGVSALVVAAAMAFGLPFDTWYQVFSFSGISIVLLLLVRRPLLARLRLTQADRAQVDDVIGETVVVRERLVPGQTGRAELRGTLWNARNAGQSSLDPGTRCRVTSVEGLTVAVVAENAPKGGA
jgi:inner membrane protein